MDRYTQITTELQTEIVDVCLGIDNETRRRVRIRIFKECGLTLAAKELDFLDELAHCDSFVNLVEKIDLPVKRASNRRSREPAMIVVTEALDSSLADVLQRNPGGLPLHVVRRLAHQLLSGVKAAHDAGIYFRDLNPLKIRYEDFTIKISEFYHAKKMMSVYRGDDCTPPMDLKVPNLTYQAPELLRAHNSEYDGRVDMWSVGCIIAEMTTGNVLFGNKETNGHDQFLSILRVMGTPAKNLLPNSLKEAIWKSLPLCRSTWMQEAGYIIREKLNKSGLELIEGLIRIDPRERFTVEEALAHEFFK